MATKLVRAIAFLLFFQGVYLNRTNNTQSRLLDYLFKDNEIKELLPVKNYSDAVSVEFGITLIKIKDVNAKEQTIQVHVWITQKWTNPFLTWNESMFPGMSSINVKPDKIWVPDIILYNNVDEQDRTGGGSETYKTLVRLYQNGTNFWSSPALFKAICVIDVAFFPLDQQKCKLKFGSWTYDSSKLKLSMTNVTFPSSNFIKNGEWAIYKVFPDYNSTTYEGRPEEYMHVALNIYMRRKSLDYLINLVIPCLMISCMTFLGFILPPESGERVGLSITVLLAMTVFQQLTSEIMPSYDFPLLGQYYFATILEIGLALLITTIILNFYHRTNRHMPRWLRVLLLDWMARFVFLHESAEKCSKSRKKTIKRGIKDNVDAVINNGYIIGEHQNDVTNGGRSPFENGNGCNDNEDNSHARSTPSDQTVLRLTLGSIGSELTSNTQNEHGLFTDETGATVSEEEMRMRHQQWTLAAKILDRFFLWGSAIVGLATILAIFLRAPGVWENHKELHYKN